MTRKQIETEYTVKDGIIQDLGRFEGEYLYTPYFYDSTLDGCAEELSYMEDGCGEYAALVQVTDDDRKEFPEIDAATVYMLVTQSETGFIGCKELTEEQAQRERDSYEEFNADYGDASD